jgi:hypothetical protein
MDSSPKLKKGAGGRKGGALIKGSYIPFQNGL